MKYKKLLNYYESVRQVGNSTLLQKGAENYDQPFFLLGATKELAEQFLDIPNSNMTGISIKGNTNKLVGSDKPIAIDSSAWYVILKEVDEKISELNTLKDDHKKVLKSLEVAKDLNIIWSERVEELKYQHVAEMENFTHDIKKLSLFDRIFNFKKIINDKTEA